MARSICLAAVLSYLSLTGCSETTQRLDGVTPGAGDAIAANTAMQMVDPWLYGVQNTNLVVPADRGDSASSDDGSSGTSTTTDSSGTN